VAIALDLAGNLYVADRDADIIRMITPDGTVSTIGGTFGQQGSADGTGPEALFSNPGAIAVDAGGHLYVGDSMNGEIRVAQAIGPPLQVAGSSGQVVVSWPRAAADFGLEFGANLAPGAWSPVPSPPTVAGNSLLVTNAAPGGAGFYRLRKP
jgi:hypothetical protein